MKTPSEKFRARVSLRRHLISLAGFLSLAASPMILLGCALGTKAHPSNGADQQLHQEAKPTLRVSTFLLFNGTCRPAMEFYRSVFGGELTLTTVGDSPMKGMFPPALHSRIVNARLVGASIDVSGTDWLRADATPTRGNTVCLYVRSSSREEISTVFRRLSEGAEVTDPLRDQPFGFYGTLNDRFGVRWMFVSDKQ